MANSELPIFLRHPELHHYTDWRGLEGIFRSNQLWATHYRTLNDTCEILHLKEPLKELLLAKLVRKAQNRHSGAWSFVLSVSLSELVEASSWIVDRMYEVTFHHNGVSAPLACPFISCFCSHSLDEEYERNNGLLSQWRGYGGDCSYCLVFDTEELYRLLKPEGLAYEYSALTMLPVLYEDKSRWEFSAEEILPDLEQAVVARLKGDREAPDGLPNLVLPFIHMACGFKHRAFAEEREIRIVASPFTPESLARFSPGRKAVTSSQHGFKTVHSVGVTRRLRLFETIQARLPIRRVIVGPSPEQHLAVEEAKQLLPNHIEVVASATPYRGK